MGLLWAFQIKLLRDGMISKVATFQVINGGPVLESEASAGFEPDFKDIRNWIAFLGPAHLRHRSATVDSSNT